MRFLIITFISILFFNVKGQTSFDNILSEADFNRNEIKSVRYTNVFRYDDESNDTLRFHTKVYIERDELDEHIGFKFWIKEYANDGQLYRERLYLGSDTLWDIDHFGKKTSFNVWNDERLNGFTDLRSLYTSIENPLFREKIDYKDEASKTELLSDKHHHILRYHLPDTEIFRNTTYTFYVDKENKLPTGYIQEYAYADQTVYNEVMISDIEMGVKMNLQRIRSSIKNADQYIPEDLIITQGLPKDEIIDDLSGWWLADSTAFDFEDFMAQNTNTKLVVFDLWFQNCAPCILAIPEIEALQQKFKDKGVVILGVNPEADKTKRQKLQAFMQEKGVKEMKTVMTSWEYMFATLNCDIFPTYYIFRVDDQQLKFVDYVSTPKELGEVLDKEL